jgi:hypothetical protein
VEHLTVLARVVPSDGFAVQVSRAIAEQIGRTAEANPDSPYIGRHESALKELAAHALSRGQQDQRLAILWDLQAARGRDSDYYDLTPTQVELLRAVGIGREPQSPPEIFAEFIRAGVSDTFGTLRHRASKDQDWSLAAQKYQAKAEELEAQLADQVRRREAAEDQRGEINAELVAARKEIEELRETLAGEALLEAEKPRKRTTKAKAGAA